jgi:hypothetical protein
VRVEGENIDGLGAVGAVFRVAQRNRRDVLHLPGGPVELRDLAAAAAVDNVRVERIGRDVAIFDDAHGMPLAEGDGAIVAAAGDADRTALLLAAANAIGKSCRLPDVIELRGGLVVPGTPGAAPPFTVTIAP